MLGLHGRSSRSSSSSTAAALVGGPIPSNLNSSTNSTVSSESSSSSSSSRRRRTRTGGSSENTTSVDSGLRDGLHASDGLRAARGAPASAPATSAQAAAAAADYPIDAMIYDSLVSRMTKAADNVKVAEDTSSPGGSEREGEAALYNYIPRSASMGRLSTRYQKMQDGLDFAQAGVLVSEGSVRSRSRKRGHLRLGKPMEPGAEAWLSQRGVDTGALVAALPFKASQLTLERVQKTWGLLEEYEVPQLPALLRIRPSILAVDPDATIRPKIELVGLRGADLGLLLSGHPSFPYTTVESFKGTFEQIRHHVEAAIVEGLVSGGSRLSHFLAAKARQWASVLVLSPQHVQRALDTLKQELGLSDAQCGASLAGFPMLLVSARPKIQAVCAGFKEALGDAEAARLLTARPAMHRIALDHFRSNVRFLCGDLGFSAAQLSSLIIDHPGTFGHLLSGPLSMHLFQVCQEHLGLSPALMLTTHANCLRCSPRNAAARVAFLSARKQLGELRSMRFLKDSEQEWSRRLGVMKVPWQEWERYKRKYWEDPERALLLEEARRHVAAVRRRAGRTLVTAPQGEEGPAGSGLPAGEETVTDALDGEVSGKQVKL
ncbi:hypothetical protein N2152v2_005520 [Parachlorella kessleri]